MSNLPARWTTCALNGTRIIAPGVETGQPPTIQFGEDPPIALPTHATYPVAGPDVFGGSTVIFKGQNGAAYRVRRTSKDVAMLGGTYGTYCVGITAAGREVIQLGPSAYWAGSEVHPIPTPYVGTVEGFLSVDGEEPQWTLAQQMRPFRIAGRRLALATEQEGWLIGQDTTSNNYLGRSPDGREWIAGTSAGSPLAPRLTVHPNGTATLSRSYPSGWFHSNAWELMQAEPLPSEASMDLASMDLALPAYPRPIAFAPFFMWTNRADWGDCPNPYGNMALVTADVAQKTALPLIQMWTGAVSQGHLGRTWAYFLHWEAAVAGAREQYEALLALPERPIFFYAPWEGDLPGWVETRRTFPTLTLYREAGQSLEAFEARQRERLARVAAWGLPMGIIPQAYDRARGEAGKNEALETVPLVDGWIREFPIVGVFPFSERRPGGMGDYEDLSLRYRWMARAVPARPNRYDYWLSANWQHDLRASKLKYTLLNLRAEERVELGGE